MKKLKIGLFGVGRGMDIAKNFMLLDCEIVAVCDFHEKRLQKAIAQLGKGVAVYRDFDEFIEHDMDAVILANYFHEHAPYAIKCFERGIHVFSECISNGTMAEGVELMEAFEKSDSIYMLAENYPQMKFNREMQRICAGGTLGKILYAEGEYNHPGNPADTTFRSIYNYFPNHWRNFLPRTYYITHSLGPLMRATGATPKKVTAFATYLEPDREAPRAKHVSDAAAIVTMLNDDDSVFRVTGCAQFGNHHNAYRICGTKGQIENLRGMGEKVMLRYNAWQKPADMPEVNLYEPGWNDKDESLISQSGHGGGDYITARIFVECIKEGKQPPHPFDIHGAIAMSSVGILAHRSMLEGGVPYDIPDFTKDEWKEKYRNDRLSPIPLTDGTEPTLPCNSHEGCDPTEAQIKAFFDEIKDM